MAIPAYTSPGMLLVIIANTMISFSFVKEFIRFALGSVGIRVPSWEDDEILVDSSGCLRAPNDVFVDEFRRQLPAVAYESIPSLDCQPHNCMICLAVFNPQAKVNRLLCGHVFHKSCLEKWMSYWNPTCPLCRMDMMVEYTEVGEDGGGEYTSL